MCAGSRSDYDRKLEKAERKRRRSVVCDKSWFSAAMHDPHVNLHTHCTDFDDGEFDAYLLFMRAQMATGGERSQNESL